MNNFIYIFFLLFASNICYAQSASIFGVTRVDQNQNGEIDLSDAILNQIPITYQLFADNDLNGAPDSTTPVDEVTTTTGQFAFIDVAAGNYVIVQSQPSGFVVVNDGDTTFDGDNVSNTDPLDNTIPVTIFLPKVDADNTFLEDFILVPIELGFFDVQFNLEDDVEITWQTLTENNSDYFAIERSENGIVYHSIGQIDSKAENGHSNLPITYSFLDKNTDQIQSEFVYYRVKQVDMNGEFSYTPIRTLSFFDQLVEASVIFPNPVKLGDTVHVIEDSISLIEVFDMNGQLMFRREEMNVSSTSFSTNSLAKGLYILMINKEKKQEFIVQ